MSTKMHDNIAVLAINFLAIVAILSMVWMATGIAYFLIGVGITSAVKAGFWTSVFIFLFWGLFGGIGKMYDRMVIIVNNNEAVVLENELTLGIMPPTRCLREQGVNFAFILGEKRYGSKPGDKAAPTPLATSTTTWVNDKENGYELKDTDQTIFPMGVEVVSKIVDPEKLKKRFAENTAWEKYINKTLSSAFVTVLREYIDQSHTREFKDDIQSWLVEKLNSKLQNAGVVVEEVIIGDFSLPESQQILRNSNPTADDILTHSLGNYRKCTDEPLGKREAMELVKMSAGIASGTYRTDNMFNLGAITGKQGKGRGKGGKGKGGK